MEWAIEVATSTTLPVAATMCIGPEGDMHGVSAGVCAVRMAKAGKYIHRLHTYSFIINSACQNARMCRPTQYIGLNRLSKL